MIKKLIVLASILLSLTSWAQDNTASPYSYFGLGEVKFKGTVRDLFIVDETCCS